MIRLSSQVKILTKYKNIHVWNDPLYQVKRLIHNQWKSIWLQQAWGQGLMSFLRYCLIKPILQVRKSLREKILGNLFSNSFLYQLQKRSDFPAAKAFSHVKWSIKDYSFDELPFRSLSSSWYIHFPTHGLSSSSQQPLTKCELRTTSEHSQE